jgi:hypothetical protein
MCREKEKVPEPVLTLAKNKTDNDIFGTRIKKEKKITKRFAH